MRRFLVAAVVFGAVSSAQAADMPDFLRGGFTEGLSTSRVNWQGYYVGGQAAWGSMRTGSLGGINSDLIAGINRWPPPNTSYTWNALGTANSISTGFGAFVGYNSQWDDVVVGVEANYLHGGFRASSHSAGYTYDPNTLQLVSTTSSNASVNVSDFGSLRLRAGYAMGCFLPYAFLGAGFGDEKIERNVSAYPAPLILTVTSASKEKLVYGYSAGVGVDFMLIGGLFARVEYEYQRVTSDIESNINTVRAGLGYKF